MTALTLRAATAITTITHTDTPMTTASQDPRRATTRATWTARVMAVDLMTMKATRMILTPT